MSTITTFFDLIIDKQKVLHYSFPKLLQKPAHPNLIRDTEQILKIKFNKELKELYSLYNGTDLSGEIVSGEIGLIPIHAFLSLSDAVSYYHASMKSEDQFYNWIDDFAPDKKLFPFLEDGAGNCYWVDLNENTPHYNKIYWTNTFGDTPDYRFNSLTSMFQVICESYSTGIIHIDEDGYLDCDYTRWGELAQKHNPNLHYWERYLAS